MRRRLVVGRVTRWSTRSHGPLVAGAVAAVAGWWLPGLAAMACGVAVLVGDVVRDHARFRAIVERRRPEPLDVPFEPPYDSWSRITLGRWHAIHDPELDARLAAGAPIGVRRVRRRWKPEPRGERVRLLRRLAVDFDHAKPRLATDLLASTGEVTLRRVPYSAMVVTNKLGVVSLTERDGGRLLDAEHDVLRDGLLPTLGRSRCSNHLGADVIAIVDDGRVLLTRQSARNQLSANLLAASGSGSIDWTDLRRGDDLLTTVRRAMRREMLEELGIARSDAPGLDAIRVLGFARLGHLSGSPLFSGVARLSGLDERIRRPERRYVSQHVTIDYDQGRGVADLRRVLGEFAAGHRHELSFPLFASLRMLDRWLDTDPGAAGWLGLPRP